MSAAKSPPSSAASLLRSASLVGSLLVRPSSSAAVSKTVEVDHAATYQEFHGCGASWTDSSAWLVYGDRANPDTDPPELTAATRDAVFDELFDPAAGIGLRILRQPMGTSDFRWEDYTYEDTEGVFDVGRDVSYVIPTVSRTVTDYPDVKVMGVPWSPPAWMKRPESLNGGSLAKPLRNSYDSLGSYFANYVKAYEDDHEVPIWAVSVQNEPQHATGQYPTMKMTAAEHANAAKAIRAALDADGRTHVKLVAYDHNWDTPEYPIEVLADPDARLAIDAVAFHCYSGDPSRQSEVEAVLDDGQEIFFTECTEFGDVTSFNGDFRWAVENLVVGAVRNWASTVIEWNLVLYESGPKAPGGCENCRGLVDIVNSTHYEKRPAYYALGHLSKFARAGARRVGSTEPDAETRTVALLNADGSALAVILNNGGGSVDFTVRWFDVNCAVAGVPARSAVTVVSTDPADRTAGVQVWATRDDAGTRLTRTADAACVGVGGPPVGGAPTLVPSSEPSEVPRTGAPVGAPVACGDYSEPGECRSNGCKWRQQQCQT